jgi:hypothetical protein
VQIVTENGLALAVARLKNVRVEYHKQKDQQALKSCCILLVLRNNEMFASQTSFVQITSSYCRINISG